RSVRRRPGTGRPSRPASSIPGSSPEGPLDGGDSKKGQLCRPEARSLAWGKESCAVGRLRWARAPKGQDRSARGNAPEPLSAWDSNKGTRPMWTVIGILIKILIVVGATQGAVAYLIYVERKVAAYAQDRIGPNRAGREVGVPFGLLQPLADAAKMLL